MRILRWIITLAVVAGVTFVGNPAFARGKNAASEEVRAAINEIKENKLADVLDLPTDETVEFMELYTQWEEVRWSYKERRSALLAELQSILTGDADRARSLKGVLDDVDTTDAEARASEEDLRKEFRALLNDEQYGKLLLFENNFNKSLRRLIQEQNMANFGTDAPAPAEMETSPSPDTPIPQPVPVGGH
jgi:hypothetical protein